VKRRDFISGLGAGLATTLVPAVRLSATTRSAGSRPDRLIERWSWAMGQPVHLQLYAASESQGYDAAAAALAELRRVESRLSLFDDASDLCELNRQAGRRPIRVSEDLTAVLQAALRAEHDSGGAFNPAIEPLMRTWGFHRRRAAEPTAAEIREARDAVRAARIEIREHRVWLPSAETRLDLGGIGVGYGLDRAMAVLARAGIGNALLDISGDCIATGAPPAMEAGWLVAIASPGGGPTLSSTYLRDASLATSANTVSVVRYGRAVRGHVMDPETGWPAERLVQVTVVARNGVEADALSTAMLVSGRPVRGVLRYFSA